MLERNNTNISFIRSRLEKDKYDDKRLNVMKFILLHFTSFNFN